MSGPSLLLWSVYNDFIRNQSANNVSVYLPYKAYFGVINLGVVCVFLYNFIASIHKHRLLIFIECTCVLKFFIASVYVIQPMCEMDLSGFD